MRVRRSFPGNGCVNCDARFAFADVRALLYRLRFGVGLSERSFRPQFRMSYGAPDRNRLRCPECLMEHELPRKELIRLEVIYWVIGVAVSGLAVFALFWALLPPAPPPVTLEQGLRDVFANAERSNAYLSAVIWLSVLSVPLIVLCFWLVRRAVVLLVRLDPVAATVHPATGEVAQ